MTLATNLKAVYRACNPNVPLESDDTRYVDLSEVRGTHNIVNDISKRINFCDEGQFHQQLFTGHRGSGKTTELLRLKTELEKQKFFVIYLDAGEQLDLGNLNYLDVLLSIAKEIEAQLRASDIALNPVLLDDLCQWFSERVIEENQSSELSGSGKSQAEAGIEIPFFAKLLSSITAEIKSGSSRRVSTRQKLEQELAVFISKLNALIGNARDEVKRHQYADLVLVVDGLEKMAYRLMEDGYSNHAHVFVLHAEQMKAPQCHIIYTIPITLAYNKNLGADFNSETIVLPMVKMNDQGIACLRQIIENRVDLSQTFDAPSDVTALIERSGGVVRDLMRLIQDAVINTDGLKIGREEIANACTTLTRDYERMLQNSEIKALFWVHKNKRVTGELIYARSLSERIILEYQNGVRWAALHPAVLAVPWLQRAFAEAEAEEAATPQNG